MKTKEDVAAKVWAERVTAVQPGASGTEKPEWESVADMTRDQIRNTRPTTRRSFTFSPKHVNQGQLDAGRELYPEDTSEGRPRTRGECAGGERPCPYVSCRYHLFLDVNPSAGSVKLNFPDLEVWEMNTSCALDVADQGGVSLDGVGTILNLTRERARQIEFKALRRVQISDRKLHGALDEHARDTGLVRQVRALPMVRADEDDDEDDGEDLPETDADEG